MSKLSKAMKKYVCLLSLINCLTAGVMASDQVVNPTGVTGHNGGNWPASLGHLTDMLNATDVGFLTADHAPGIDTSADTSEGTNNPAVWKYSPSSWQNEWLANTRLDTNTSINAKMGWAVIDLGTVIDKLSNIFFWANTGSSPGENAKDINIYYSSGAGIDALPAMPNSQATTGDYDFSSGDWTKLNTSGVITLPDDQPSGQTPQVTTSLEQVSARYIGIEILTAYNTNYPDRVGIAQIELTSTPPPAGSIFLFK